MLPYLFYLLYVYAAGLIMATLCVLLTLQEARQSSPPTRQRLSPLQPLPIPHHPPTQHSPRPRIQIYPQLMSQHRQAHRQKIQALHGSRRNTPPLQPWGLRLIQVRQRRLELQQLLRITDDLPRQ